MPNRLDNKTRLESNDWRLRIGILLLLAIPAFSGFPLDRVPLEIVAGIPWSWVIYWLLVQAAIWILLGFPLYCRIAALAALITLPVVYAGAAISWVWLHLVPASDNLAATSIHYVRLCLNMLTVVPLALGMVVLVPLGSFERRLLTQTHGVTPMQKKALMALRVFNHIAFTVIPDILEVLREEQFGAGRFGSASKTKTAAGGIGRTALIREGVRDVIHLAVEGICAALQFIPLWAHEIARLPERKARRRHQR